MYEKNLWMKNSSILAGFGKPNNDDSIVRKNGHEWSRAYWTREKARSQAPPPLTPTV